MSIASFLSIFEAACQKAVGEHRRLPPRGQDAWVEDSLAETAYLNCKQWCEDISAIPERELNKNLDAIVPLLEGLYKQGGCFPMALALIGFSKLVADSTIAAAREGSWSLFSGEEKRGGRTCERCERVRQIVEDVTGTYDTPESKAGASTMVEQDDPASVDQRTALDELPSVRTSALRWFDSTTGLTSFELPSSPPGFSKSPAERPQTSQYNVRNWLNVLPAMPRSRQGSLQGSRSSISDSSSRKSSTSVCSLWSTCSRGRQGTGTSVSELFDASSSLTTGSAGEGIASNESRSATMTVPASIDSEPTISAEKTSNEGQKGKREEHGNGNSGAFGWLSLLQLEREDVWAT